MSLSRRDSPFANSGFVTSIELDELNKHGYKDTFASMDFQAGVEQKMFQLGDGSQKPPAQRVDDFVKGRISSDLFETSYIQDSSVPHFTNSYPTSLPTDCVWP